MSTGGKFLYITELGAAVISKIGQVITVYTRKEFDTSMQEVVQKLFGK